MQTKGAILLIICSLIVFTSGLSAADNPANWNFSLQSSGEDLSWVSTSRVNWGYTVYDFNTVMSQFELNLATDGWTDYSGEVDTENVGAGYDGLPVYALNRALDSNGITANLGMWVDEDGYAHLSMTNITFGDVNGQVVSDVRFTGNLDVTGLNVLWEDDFSGYGTDVALDSTADWSAWDIDSGNGFRVGSDFGNRVFYKNSYWGETVPHFATIDTVDSIYDFNHVMFKVDAYRHEVESVNTKWFLMGRRTSSQSVRVQAAWGPYAETIWMSVADSDGYSDGDYYVADFDSTRPVRLELEFEGNVVTGRVSHAGRSQSVSYTTTVTEPGKPGIAGLWEYGYAYGYFDDFAIVTNSPVPPEQCGDQGTIYLEGDTNEDCEINMLDMLDVAGDWVDCSDPQNSRCN